MGRCDPSVGTEELSHLEMVGTIVYQLTRNMTPEQIKAAGFDDYFVDHTAGVYPVAASGTPFNANTFSVTGDTIADLHEDLSADAAMLKKQPSSAAQKAEKAQRNTGKVFHWACFVHIRGRGLSLGVL